MVGANAGAAGYILTGYAMDNGPAASGPDTVSITLRSATGTVIFSATGSVSEGDVAITR